MSSPSPHSRDSSAPASTDHPEPTHPPYSSSSTPSNSPPPPTISNNNDQDFFSSSKLFSSLYNRPSSSSSPNPSNPLLPSLPNNTASALASKYDPSLSYFQSSSSSSSSSTSSITQGVIQQPPRIPERCFSFCSQTDGIRPLCRMFCLRKRQPILTREEQLKRLRPSISSNPNRSTPIDAGGGSSSSSSSSDVPWYRIPFEALRKKVDPYSFIYIKGTPDGVIGRYMEELEWDDGEYDFGSISRGVDSGVVKGKKRKEGEGWVWLDWGDHGSLLHLPLSTIFHPILSIPNTLSNLLTPSYNLLKLYSTSFSDGAQLRSLERFSKEIERGGATEMLGKLRGYWEKRVKETREKREEMMKQLKEERGREVEGGKGE
ncbi:uncharacterized protein IL334_007669 [Kwoniella shivajii]|uniref:ASX DEUBAD domain-containing protein n=1 Tax=Kwoniella shivajii TaxID=564305 RepID=A0ABZ1DCF6_9TREE|nr:hypothetical protein IL334_007669 [Kwoniella shivajii]